VVARGQPVSCSSRQFKECDGRDDGGGKDL
jgi:hypothetical protein